MISSRFSSSILFLTALGGECAWASDATLIVRLTGFTHARGVAGCTLYRSADGFPTDQEQAAHAVWCPITEGTATCTFPPVPAGEAAVACFHDENQNGTLDRSWMGLPTEPYVVSNHARASFGPPRWVDAKFTLSSSTLVNLTMGG